ncbi:hypothetical protein [Saccharothrix texasensis]|uniref:hypothetical protein n=1 Tax=Saccharothrix texasensis TaxID=103734 RepID=UPI0014773623|nr:hypothetical protein [Saccharothrix texasensis]
MAEVDLRYAADMPARLHALNPAPLGEERAPTERIVGCCRAAVAAGRPAVPGRST